ncbi:MAG: hypothetical protein CMH57_05110 [Myxococcales bacterium]|nr:hypothetical protein [Myxococcales bacterium]
MKGMRLAVLLDASMAELGHQLDNLLGETGRCFVYDDPAHLSEALSTIHADGYDCIGAAGDDALLARVCGALPPDTTARVLPMPWGDGALFVSQDIGVGDDAPALAKRFATMSRRGSGLLGRGGALRDAPRATLRVSLSSWRRPSIAFTVGIGAAGRGRDISSLRARARVMTRSFMRDVKQRMEGSNDALFSVRAVVDHQPFAERVAVAVVSSLQRGPLGLRISEQPWTRPGFGVLWSDLNLALTLGASRLPERLREAGVQTRAAHHMNLDLMAPLAIDGLSVDENEPLALGLRPGRVAPLVCIV